MRSCTIALIHADDTEICIIIRIGIIRQCLLVLSFFAIDCAINIWPHINMIQFEFIVGNTNKLCTVNLQCLFCQMVSEWIKSTVKSGFVSFSIYLERFRSFGS